MSAAGEDGAGRSPEADAELSDDFSEELRTRQLVVRVTMPRAFGMAKSYAKASVQRARAEALLSIRVEPLRKRCHSQETAKHCLTGV